MDTSNHVLLLFKTSWTGFTGSQFTLASTSKSPPTLTYKTPSFGHLQAYLRELSLSIQTCSPTAIQTDQLLLPAPHVILTSGQHVFSYSSLVICYAIPLSATSFPIFAI